jgi:hypothetical protein
LSLQRLHTPSLVPSLPLLLAPTCGQRQLQRERQGWVLLV